MNREKMLKCEENSVVENIDGKYTKEKQLQIKIGDQNIGINTLTMRNINEEDVLQWTLFKLHIKSLVKDA